MSVPAFPAAVRTSSPGVSPNAVPHQPGPDLPGTRRALSVMAATAEAVPLLRRFARDTARQWNLDDRADEALAVVVTELVANVVRHSGSPDVAVLLTTTDRTVTVRVHDGGRWRPRRTRLPGDDLDACCGRGLDLVRAYATDCAVVRTALGTRVAVTLATDAGHSGGDDCGGHHTGGDHSGGDYSGADCSSG
ncbi:ATP-binding protein [Streptomyces sp. NPDC127114]|uniref:ATP-binding protein n=1 Tax=Streptomyces sp. NPDC127114 TaxID=3345366 RepID=UPI003629433A